MCTPARLLTLFLSVGFCYPLQGQVAESMTVQGLLTDGSSALEGSFDLTFSLFDQVSGGAQVWTQTLSGVPVSDGVYNVMLGPEGTPPFRQVPFDRPLWLQVSVGGETVGPRTPLASVPYALGLRGLRVFPNQGAYGFDAPSVVGGHKSNRVESGVLGGTIGGGGQSESNLEYLNIVAGNYGTVGGGIGNWVGREHDLSGTTEQPFGTVSGGRKNSTGGAYGAVGGGESNWVFDDYGTIAGGQGNRVGKVETPTTTEAFSIVAGGTHNAVLAPFGAIGGGGRTDAGRPYGNVIYDPWGVIAGGADNTVGVDNAHGWDGQYSTVGGGTTNRSLGPYTVVGGGDRNEAQGAHATVGGGELNRADWAQAVVAGGSENEATATAGAIGGGARNVVYDEYGTVSGGQQNAAGSEGSDMTNHRYASVGGGYFNRASGAYARVGGGSDNAATGQQATVAGGDENTAGGVRSGVGGGSNNQAYGLNAMVAGGAGNRASGRFATVPGGFENEAMESFSFAAGRQARALHKGAFVWADSSNVAFESTDDNQFLIRAGGGVGIGTSTPSHALSVQGDVDITNRLSIGATEQAGQLYVAHANGGGNGIKLEATDGDRLNLYWNSANTAMIVDTYRQSDGRRHPIALQPVGGNVGIGTITPSERLEVDGNVKADNVTLPSDVRLKSDLAPISDAAATLAELRGVSFHWRTDLDAAPADPSRRFGVIAQDVLAVLPELVRKGADGFYSVDYLGLVPVLIEAFKAQQDELNRALGRIQALEALLGEAETALPH